MEPMEQIVVGALIAAVFIGVNVAWNWRFAKRTKTDRKIAVVRSTTMRLSEWQADESLVKQSSEMQNSPLFQAWMAVLRNESPSNSFVQLGATHDDRIAHACRAEGYHICLNNIEALAQLAKKREFIESTFAPENAG